MKQIHAYRLDLTRIEGKGDFSCPRCGTKISPDDETEDIYTILEPKVNNHGLELVIRCNKCSSQIHMTGFSILQKMSGMAEEELEGPEKQSTSWYFAHI
jgi:DNA-directed RNA polymerase subunit RPC12/RpoP